MAATKREWYAGSDDSNLTVWDTEYGGQSFTVGNTGVNEDFDITSVKVKAWSLNSPPTLTLALKAVDGAGKPTGADLSTGTTDPSGWGGSPGSLREISMTSYTCKASTQYVFILRCPGGDGSNIVVPRYESNSASYAGGKGMESTDSGVNWIDLPGEPSSDLVFEIWGETAEAESESKKSIGNLSARPDKEIVPLL